MKRLIYVLVTIAATIAILSCEQQSHSSAIESITITIKADQTIQINDENVTLSALATTLKSLNIDSETVVNIIAENDVEMGTLNDVQQAIRSVNIEKVVNKKS
ncbi:MAG: biopolymer transporter ExbD [Calditrichia bacterium]|nr:biopolymer transporter ExbD [Calditrichota bacterium]MCB0269146.1 biopolymer transporter ExbD [Calditrichota bacterium]